MPETTLIKRYSNRRLYDTDSHCYITMDQVADIIKKGGSVQVVDAKSGEDITAYVLLQVVLEEAKKRNNLLPASLLHIFIRYGENLLAEFFENYLEEAIKAYVSYKSMTSKQFQQWLSLGFDFSDLASKTVNQMNLLKSFMDTLSDRAEDKEKQA